VPYLLIVLCFWKSGNIALYIKSCMKECGLYCVWDRASMFRYWSGRHECQSVVIRREWDAMLRVIDWSELIVRVMCGGALPSYEWRGFDIFHCFGDCDAFYLILVLYSGWSRDRGGSLSLWVWGVFISLLIVVVRSHSCLTMTIVRNWMLSNHLFDRFWNDYAKSNEWGRRG